MPYHTENDHPDCSGYAVVKDSDGEVMGCHKTRREANGQIRALYANEQSAALAPIPWEGILCFEGMAAEDSTEAPRIMLPDSLSWRELPIPLMAMTATSAGGHEGAELAGRIDRIWREPYAEGITAIMGAGEFTNAYGINEIAPGVEDESLRGVSIDMAAAVWVPVRRDTLEPNEQVTIDELLSGGYYMGLRSAVIAAATICPVQGMADAKIALVASASTTATFVFTGGIELVPEESEALTAAAVGIAPLEPPAEWFMDPQFTELTPLTITDDGRVYGHLAPWGVCHRGVLHQCVLAPRSRTGYREFEVGALRTAEGEVVRVGKITVGAPHATTKHGQWTVDAVRHHYDETGTVGAFVRAGEDRFGPWVAGAVRSDASPEVVRDMLANPLSGDWRGGELIAALCVPVPGFAVPRTQATLVASATGLELETLIAGLDLEDGTAEIELVASEACGECDGTEMQARLQVLALAADGGLGAIADVT